MKWCMLVTLVPLALGFFAEARHSPQPVRGDIWAVLLAGSKSWFNYRHQADVCHSYQILHAHGVPDDHIIVMMYDDIANSKENPTPGTIINRPGGPDVYQGVPKDYTGVEVTPANFLKVLRGDAEGLKGVGSGKVLKSGPNDRVFINMVDHGAPGIFGFPTTFLHAKNFSSTILAMHRNKQYSEMMIYLESCESGSMFQNLLPDDIGVYALSAANASQPSFACYMDNKRHTFLGDVFSVKWMEDTDRENILKEPLKRQYHLVRKEVNTSHVMQWGEIGIDKQIVGTFFGTKKGEDSDYGPFPHFDDPCLNTSSANPDVPMVILQSHVDAAESENEATYWTDQLAKLKQNRAEVNQTIKKIAETVTGDSQLALQMVTDTHHVITNWSCYEPSVQTFNDICFDLSTNTYALRVLHVLVNLCEHGYAHTEITDAARAVC